MDTTDKSGADSQHRLAGAQPGQTYKILRFFQSDDYDTQVIKRGLTLDEAQAHCNDPETSSSTATNPAAVERTRRFGAWFDGWTEDKK
jgi:hypothetical protein